MATSAGAREEILRRVRAAIKPTAGASEEQIAAEWSGIAREYRRVGSLAGEELLELLEDRLRDYDAGVYRCEPAKLAETIGQILSGRGKQRMALAEGLPVEWLPEGVRFTIDDRQGIAMLDASEGVLTSATLAIAQTGTIVLQDAPGQGRRAATLLPDYHLCVVQASAVVETVPEAMHLLEASADKSTTFFSGPSATADIEMTRIKGVHGPRFVDVILVL